MKKGIHPLSIAVRQHIPGIESRMKRQMDHRTSTGYDTGFTLLEIIATILISAVLAVILVQVMGNQSMRSYLAIDAYDNSLALKNAMENITADYRHLMLTHATPLLRLQDNLDGDDGFSGYWKPEEPVSVTHYCLDLVPAADETQGLVESNRHNNCTINDTILKINLHNGTQTLTALFSR
jgi:prepilin-type N-terminal cleavage/methylation domain-containing protein